MGSRCNLKEGPPERNGHCCTRVRRLWRNTPCRWREQAATGGKQWVPASQIDCALSALLWVNWMPPWPPAAVHVQHGPSSPFTAVRLFVSAVKPDAVQLASPPTSIKTLKVVQSLNWALGLETLSPKTLNSACFQLLVRPRGSPS